MTKQNILLSFDYENDINRAEQIRKMNIFDDTTIMPGAEWLEVEKKQDDEIKHYIDDNVEKCSCLVVLVGEKTAENKWINYEIKKAHELKKGLLGIYVHGIADANGNQSKKGENPFKEIRISDNKTLANFVVCFDSDYQTSRYVYDDIKKHIGDFVKDAVASRKRF